MALPTAPTAEAPRGPQPGIINLGSLIPEGVSFSEIIDLAASDTQAGADAVTAKLQGATARTKSKAQRAAPIEQTTQNSKDPTPIAPQIQDDPLNPAPVPEPVAKPTPEPEPSQEPEGQAEPSPEDALLDAFEPKEPEKKVDPKKPTAATDLDADPEAPIDLPKSAKDMSLALITLSKKAREQQKLIKIKDAKLAEFAANGSIDLAAQAQEPLRQQLEATQKQYRELEAVVASTNLERRPEFQALIRPSVLANNYLTEVGKSNPDVDMRGVYAAVNIADPKERKQAVRAACADLPPDELVQAIQAVEAIHITNGQVAQVRANAVQYEAAAKKAESEKQAAAQAQRHASIQKAQQEAYEEFTADPVMKALFERNPEGKKKFDGLLDQAKAVLQDQTYAQDPKKFARAIQMALAYEPMKALHQQEIRGLATELKKARAELLKFKQPAIGLQQRSAYVAPQQNNGAPQTTESLVKGAFANVRDQLR